MPTATSGSILQIDDYLASMDAHLRRRLDHDDGGARSEVVVRRSDAAGWVTRVVEKQVISDEATVGIYNFRRGRDFVSGADQMIAKNLRVNGEFYVAPVYNELIEARGAHRHLTTSGVTAPACTASALPPTSNDS